MTLNRQRIVDVSQKESIYILFVHLHNEILFCINEILNFFYDFRIPHPTSDPQENKKKNSCLKNK